jgi:hypothetical protein
MTERREYSEAERTHWVAVVARDGLGSAWRESGIPKPTLARWCHKAGVETYQPEKTHAATEALKAMHGLRRETLRVQLLDKAVDLLERMDSEHVDFKGKDADEVVYPIAPAAAVQNYATSVGILIDKYRLEMGEVTGRTESQTVTGGMNDDERTRLRDAIDRFYGRGSAGSGDDGRTADSGSDRAGTEVRE